MKIRNVICKGDLSNPQVTEGYEHDSTSEVVRVKSRFIPQELRGSTFTASLFIKVLPETSPIDKEMRISCFCWWEGDVMHMKIRRGKGDVGKAFKLVWFEVHFGILQQNYFDEMPEEKEEKAESIGFETINASSRFL